MLQRTAKLVPRAVDIRLHGAEGQVQRGGDLLVGTPLDVPEHDAGAVFGAELGDGALDGGAELAGFHLVQGGLGVVGDVEAGGLHRLGGHGMWGPVHAHGVELPLTQMIDRHVVGDLEQPRRELEVRAVAIEVREHLDEGVLREVFGQLPIADHAIDEREDGPLVPLDQLSMCRVPPLQGEGDDVGIGEIREIEGAEHDGRCGSPRPVRGGKPARLRESYVSRDRQSSVALARVVTAGELSVMHETSIEERRADAAAEGGAEKSAYVRTVFEQIAPRYDLLNHLLSLNIDRRWRRRALRALEWTRAPTGQYLDLCAGTLDVGAELSHQRGFDGFVIGADFAVPMLEAGKGKAPASALAPVAADAQRLPLPDASVDGAIVAFGIRNVASLDAALREVHRVLAPGGTFVVLEFTTPRSTVVRALYHFYFHRLLPLIGGAISGHRTAYRYLPQSVAHFPAEPELARRMTDAGFRDVKWESLTLGIAAIHRARKA